MEAVMQRRISHVLIEVLQRTPGMPAPTTAHSDRRTVERIARAAAMQAARTVRTAGYRFTPSTPSSAGSVLKPAFSSRFATSRGTSRPLVRAFGLPV